MSKHRPISNPPEKKNNQSLPTLTWRYQYDSLDDISSVLWILRATVCDENRSIYVMLDVYGDTCDESTDLLFGQRQRTGRLVRASPPNACGLFARSSSRVSLEENPETGIQEDTNGPCRRRRVLTLRERTTRFATFRFFMYKMPGGYDVAYFDANSPNARTSKLQVLERALDDRDEPVALINTLRSLLPSVYEKQTTKKRSYLMYSDQPDGATPSNTYAHAKGVLGAEEDGTDAAFWLIHSTPHFPSPSGSSKFYFPDGETKFGQTFLCVSLGSGALDDVAYQLRYARPYVYFDNLLSSAKGANPNLKALLDKDFITDAGTSTKKLKIGTKTFTSFAKNKNWGNDVYEDLIAPGLKAGLLVETWMRGSEIGSYCTPKSDYDVMDVNAMDAYGADGTTKITWTEGSDHSKWAISVDGSNQVCVGDLNRMTTQRDRGGGALCFTSSGLCNTLNNSVTDADWC